MLKATQKYFKTLKEINNSYLHFVSKNHIFSCSNKEKHSQKVPEYQAAKKLAASTSNLLVIVSLLCPTPTVW